LVPKKRGEIVRVRIVCAPPCELEQRKKIEQVVVQFPEKRRSSGNGGR
jgi:hypothetical protein